ncbi:hypothetical protein [Shewanella dokdonensis]|uniref:Solute-binding protein family 3/N-terminal domain-containing protein n=1 Tax=Shewanella dokdonensis TaxID=712036 RepID=A0ABX8DHM3_9GAMM|nr:hypothetical protein [Shewanella dokdonensis]MCL1075954.1 hypothetical protein [Shewanella dokdonensis]QVK24266.1 hypothetical protein KHX94_06900 [Shewanella dokdonensis]
MYLNLTHQTAHDRWWVCLWLVLLVPLATWAMPVMALTPTVFYYQGAEDESDGRNAYVKAVLQLALEKTEDEYGPFTMLEAGGYLNKARLLRELQQGHFNNLFVRASVTNEMLANFAVVEFPLARGMAGYRVAFIRAEGAELQRFCQLDKSALQQLSIVQGIGWLDSQILQANGFKVQQVSHYQNMFSMLRAKRADLFFRAINEIDIEQQQVAHDYGMLQVEPCLALYYPLPRFFITDKNNTKNAERVYRGLVRAYADGSFIRLWQHYFDASIKRLQQRRIIPLNNPFIDQLDPQYQRYNVNIELPQSSAK